MQRTVATRPSAPRERTLPVESRSRSQKGSNELPAQGVDDPVGRARSTDRLTSSAVYRLQSKAHSGAVPSLDRWPRDGPRRCTVCR
eukprot:scaffold25129_cov84-Isochrysis_galbana.AAC.2